jgi:hypothetical protein
VTTGALSFVTAVFGFDGFKLGDFKDLVSKWRGGFFGFVRFKGQATFLAPGGPQIMNVVHLLDRQKLPALPGMAGLSAVLFPFRCGFFPDDLGTVRRWRLRGVCRVLLLGGEFTPEGSVFEIKFQEPFNGGLLSGIVEGFGFPLIHCTTSV